MPELITSSSPDGEKVTEGGIILASPPAIEVVETPIPPEFADTNYTIIGDPQGS